MYKNVPRLYTPHALGQGSDVSLSPEHSHYLRNVLRKSAGDSILFFNGKDGEWLCSITVLEKKRGVCKVEKQTREQTRTDAPLILFFAPVKKNQTDFIIQKATELGVDEICPIITDHSNSQKIRTDRWLTIAIEAAEQSERLSVPGIADLVQLKTAVKNFPENGQLVIGMERAEDAPAPEFHSDKPVGLVIGPEGGFSDEEIEFFQKGERFTPVSFGPTVLRAETAAVAGLGILQFLRRTSS